MISLTIPFRLLVSDNRKHITRSHGRGHVLTAEYRAAKDAIEHTARLAMRGKPMLTDPVRLDVAIWFPDARKRDMLNYSKLISDAISRIVIADDAQIHVAQWTRQGIDRDRPRAELTLTPLAA